MKLNNIKTLKIIYIILLIVFYILINAGSLFILITKAIEVDYLQYKDYLANYGSSTKTQISTIINYVLNSRKLAGLTADNGLYDPIEGNYWGLINGWREFLVWASAIIGWAISFIVSIKLINSNLKEKIKNIKLSKDKKKEYEALSLKLKADINQLKDKDFKKMEKTIYE